MHPAIRRMGWHGRDADLADSYLRACRHFGCSESEALTVINAYVANFGTNSNATAVDAELWLSIAAEKRGWSDKVVNAASAWHAAVEAQGGDPDAIGPLRETHDPARIDRRLREIAAYRKENRRAYFADPSLADEELRLLEARGAPAAPLPPSSRGSRRSYQPAGEIHRADWGAPDGTPALPGPTDHE